MNQNQNDTFVWKPLSIKAKQLLTWWCDSSPIKNKDFIIAAGAIRSGKTLTMSTSFILWSMSKFNGQLFGLAGKTIGSFRKNVLNDLNKIMAGRRFTVKENRLDNSFTVSNGNVVNKYEIFGGKDAGSEALIRGRTLAGLFCDEATLMPEDFINQAVGRCSVLGSKIWFNCNPDSPFHFIKKEYIDKKDEKNIFYLHFNLDDNLSLDNEIKKRYENLYTGLWYKRYIQGLWVMADGIVYDMFSPDIHIIDARNEKFDNYIVGVDYGTASVTTFGLYGYNTAERVVLIKEYYYDSRVKTRQKLDDELFDDLKTFVSGYNVKKFFIDPSASSFKLLCRRNNFPCTNVDNEVLSGIRHVAKMLHKNQFFIDKTCVETLKEFTTYTWDAKKQIEGLDSPVKKDDHAMDRNRYALYNQFKTGFFILGVEVR